MPDLLARLAADLTTCCDSPGLTYPLQMWRYALDCARTGQATPVGGTVNALPYVPDAVCALLPGGAALSVLDVGCLGGYGLFDFARRQSGRVLRLDGVDVDADGIALARAMGALWGAGALRLPAVAHIGFHAAPAERLPFPDAAFDLVIARLLLPYVEVKATLRELHRVAAPGGLLLMQTHAAGYYGRQLVRHRHDPRRLAYYSRPLLAGILFRLTGRQPRAPRWREVALSRRHVLALGAQAGLACVWMDANPSHGRPLLAFRKGDDA